MQSLVMDWLALVGLEDNQPAYIAVSLALILLISLVVHIVLHHIVFRFVERGPGADSRIWKRALVAHRLFPRMAFALQGVILYAQARVWLDTGGAIFPFIEVLTLEWVLLFVLLSTFALLSTLEELAVSAGFGTRFPLRGMMQSLKLLASIVAIIMGISLLIGKSPVILFSGLGAMTAVLMLVFKDPILGLVAGVQLSANNMLAVGDWLEMPRYGADGDVIDISLTTVKVRNWDKTITTIPSYALISDSFKNWQGMRQAGGRRIKRAISLDMTSVHFLKEPDIRRLRRLQLISDYIESKAREVDEDNQRRGVNKESPANGRHLTNLGMFRAYLSTYISQHERIHPELTRMVRQLEPGPNGIPLEIYCFTDDTDWIAYESIQADIFDHVLAVIPEFGLRVHQVPTGHDMQRMIQGMTDEGAPARGNDA